MEQDNTNKSRRKSSIGKKLIIFIALLATIVVIVYYAFDGNIPYTKGLFTTYNPLSPEPETDNNYPLEDSLLVSTKESWASMTDTIVSDTVISDIADNTVAPEDTLSDIEIDSSSATANPFKVNTSYEKITNLPAIEDEKESVGKADDLFSELLLPSGEDKIAIGQVFDQGTISYQSVLKLVVIAGQSILLEDYIKTSEEMIDIIAESDNISEIYIIDRKGNVAYTTQKPIAYKSIGKVVDDLNLDVRTVKVHQVDNKFIISIPIFHTFGKIGLAILFIK